MGATRNITLTIPDEMYREVRVRAAQLDMSVSALVVEQLRELLLSDPEVEEQLAAARRRAMVARLDEIRKRVPPMYPEDKLSREELHDRERARFEAEGVGSWGRETKYGPPGISRH